MKIKISSKDTKTVFLLKMIYLIPFVIISYIPAILYLGFKEMGMPLKEVIEMFNWNGYEKRKWRKQ